MCDFTCTSSTLLLDCKNRKHISIYGCSTTPTSRPTFIIAYLLLYTVLIEKENTVAPNSLIPSLSNLSFPGVRYTQSPTDDNLDDVVMIYDVNGFPAGVQSIVPVDVTIEDFYYKFGLSPFYQSGDFFGKKVRTVRRLVSISVMKLVMKM